MYNDYDQEFFGNDRPVSVPVVVGLLAGTLTLLERLITLGEFGLLGWTELMLAMLIGIVAGAVAWLILRAVAYFVAPRPGFTPEDVARAMLDIPIDELHPGIDQAVETLIDQDEGEPVILRFGSRPVPVEPELASLIDQVRAARVDGRLDYISKRQLGEKLGIDRYGSLATDLIDLLFAEGMTRREGQIYRFTQKGALYFDNEVRV